MLNRLRARLDVYFVALGSSAARLGLSPTVWTGLGLAASFVAAYSYAGGGYSGEALGGLFILVSGFFDVLDGAVARASGRVTKRGAFLDSTMDRVAEVAVFLGLLEGGFGGPAVVVLVLSFSLLVSYTRARAEALGKSLSGVGIGERSERLLVLAIASIVGFAYYGLLLVGVLAGFTFLERTYRASAALG